MDKPIAHAFTPGRELAADDAMSRRWLHDRHHPLLGRNVPWNELPEWPSVRMEPGFALNRVAPTHFKAYTRTSDGAIWADAADSYEEARWLLERRVRDAGW